MVETNDGGKVWSNKTNLSNTPKSDSQDVLNAGYTSLNPSIFMSPAVIKHILTLRSIYNILVKLKAIHLWHINVN